MKKVYVDWIELYPYFILYEDNRRWDNLDEVELTEEEVSDWEHAHAVIEGIEKRIRKQIGWDE